MSSHHIGRYTKRIIQDQEKYKYGEKYLYGPVCGKTPVPGVDVVHHTDTWMADCAGCLLIHLQEVAEAAA